MLQNSLDAQSAKAQYANEARTPKALELLRLQLSQISETLQNSECNLGALSERIFGPIPQQTPPVQGVIGSNAAHVSEVDSIARVVMRLSQISQVITSHVDRLQQFAQPPLCLANPFSEGK